MKNYDHLPLVDQVNVLFRRDEIHVRKPTETEREIALSFFEGKDLEMPTLLTCDSPERLNAFALRFNNKQLLVVSELSYWYLSLYDIWAVFGHEMGHVLHYDLYRLQIEKWMFEIGAWFSVLAIFKFVVYVLISPFLIVYSWWVCLLLAASIYGYRRYALPVLPSYLYLIREVLADNTSAQKNKSAMQMLTCLRTINEEVEYPDFTLREHALLWICHKENDPS
jgi:Zn-dependent protease with chaperone function